MIGPVAYRMNCDTQAIYRYMSLVVISPLSNVTPPNTSIGAESPIPCTDFLFPKEFTNSNKSERCLIYNPISAIMEVTNKRRFLSKMINLSNCRQPRR